MEQIISAQRTGNDELDLELIQKAELAIIIGIIAYIISFISANLDKEDIFSREKGLKPVNNIKASELAALSSALGLLNNIISVNVAIERLKEVESSIKSGNDSVSITPNINIANGCILSVVGSIFVTTGVIQRLNEQAQITII